MAGQIGRITGRHCRRFRKFKYIGNLKDSKCKSGPDSLPACRRAPGVQRPNCTNQLKRLDLGAEGRDSHGVQGLRGPLGKKLKKRALFN